MMLLAERVHSSILSHNAFGGCSCRESLRDIVVKQNEGGFEWKSVENIRDSTVSGTCRLEP